MAALNVGGSAASVAQKLDIVAGLGLINVPTIAGTWANRAIYPPAGHTCVLFTDVGIAGTARYYAGGRWRTVGGRTILKNLTSSVTHNTTVRTVMDFALIQAALWQEGDEIQMQWTKVLTGTDTDTTETALGTAGGTFGDAMALSGAVTNANPLVSATYRWRRTGPTAVRPVSIGGSVGLGASAAITDPTITTNLDTTDSYLQISGKLTTAGGPVTALRAFTVTLIDGA